MGFEVLDSRGEATADAPGTGVASDGQPRPPEIVDLGSSSADDGRPGGRSAAAAALPTPALLRTPRSLLLVVLGAVAAAGLAGALLGRRSAALAFDARQDATLAVAAQAVGAVPFELPIGLGAELDVTVTNFGPRPVRIGPAQQPSSGTRAGTATVLGDAVLPSGGGVHVLVRTSVDCRMGRVLTPRLGVVTADGVQHSTAVTMPDDGRPSDQLCPRRSASSSALSATVVGTVLLPAVQLVNLSAEPLRVSLPEQGLYPYREGRVLELMTRPALPTTIRPHDRLTVRLRLVPFGCRAELQDLQRLDLATLTVAGTSLRSAGREPAGLAEVDVTALVSAAMVRSCG